MIYDDLKGFLVDLPSRLDYTHVRPIQQNLFKALYYSVTNRGEYLDRLFTVSDIEKERLENFGFPITIALERKPFYRQKGKEAVGHPVGKACSRAFKKGELVYRCEECGYEESCVICQYCFNKDDHIGHNVTCYSSAGTSGGICDCGDPEAFVNELHCLTQKSNYTGDESFEIEEDFKNGIKETLQICLDYILDVMNFSIHTLPLIHQNINGRGDLAFSTKHISDYSSLPHTAYGLLDSNSDDLWYLILWNDEVHDYNEAKSGIRKATNCDLQQAEKIAFEINNNGRCILKEARDYTDLLASQKLAESDGLVSTIMSARDFMREMIVHQLINWLIDVTEFSSSISFRENCKEILAELLLQPGFEFSKLFPMEFLRETKIDIKRACFTNGFLYDGQILDLGATSVKPGLDLTSLQGPTNKLLTNENKAGPIVHSRLQFLLCFDIRFTALIRKKLPKLLISLLVSDPEKKARFAHQFIAIYPNLMNIFALSDREEGLNLLNEITVQLFTCQKTVLNILSNNLVGNIIGPITQLIEEQSTKLDPSSGYPNFIELVHDLGSKRRNISKKVAISKGIRDITHLVNKSISGHNKLDVFLIRENLTMLILFLRNFQGFWPIIKKYGDHVEVELLDFTVHLEYSSPILSIVQSITEFPTSNIELVRDAIKYLTDFLSLRKIRKNAPEIADFKVSKEPVSFINPLNSLLSFLIQINGFKNVEDILVSPSNPSFLPISDISLRSIVLAYQVKTGFWIRNGISVSKQASLYMGSLLRDVAFFRDQFLMQVASVVHEPNTFFYNVLDRWELLDWFNNKVPHDKTVYDHRFVSIIECLVIFFYNMITDRYDLRVITPAEKNRHKLKNAICYSLCDTPKAYSNIKPIFAIESGESSDYDEILQECADYQEPTGYFGTGLYRLKPSMYNRIDPLSLYLDASQLYQSVAESLMKNTANEKKVEEKSVVLEPEIITSDSTIVNEKVGAFMKTKHFAKLIYKLLQVAIDTSDETYLPQLLHLFHAILKDDELLHGDNYLNEFFVTIPISDLLLTIVESPMSSHVVFKADHLMDMLMKKDERIVSSLIDCFGEDHVQSYKRRKAAASEAEAEKRKEKSDRRKAKIMKRFAKQREKFLENNMDIDIGNDESKDSEISENHDMRVCVSCGDSESLDNPFGMFVNISKASVFLKVPESSEDEAQLAFIQLHDDLNNDLSNYPYLDMRKDITDFVAHLCGHGMHISCYLQSNVKARPCPLCHALLFLLIPSLLVPPSGGSFPQNSITGQRIHDRYNKIIESCGESSDPEVMNSVIDPRVSPLSREEASNLLQRQFVKSLSDPKAPVTQDKEEFISMIDMSSLIANTIRANEISSRFESKIHLGSFVDDITPATKALLRSLIQSRMLLQESYGGSSSNYSSQIASFWLNINCLPDVFNEMVQLFFQTDESFSTLAYISYIKMVSMIIYYLDRVLDHKVDLTKVPFKFDEEDEAAVILAVETLCFTHEGDLASMREPSEVFFAIQRLTLPLLRRMWIFKCLLTSKDKGGNVYALESGSESFDLECEDKNETADSLCSAIGIPKLSTLLRDMFEPERSSFEHRMFDMLFSAKLPLNNILIDYPGLVKLVDLPSDYGECIVNYVTSHHFAGPSVCLHCNLTTSTCVNETPIFFEPNSNTYIVNIDIGVTCSERLPGHYLTKHGEQRKQRSTEKAFLHRGRYTQLNKMWLTQEVHELITRRIFDMLEINQDEEDSEFVPSEDEIEDGFMF
ncbi:hypothetical protein HYPBUDRAFT_156174 [Hyphopichia burtonii NRRL Y-1933]|uniref:E3 ubiquitin-protein ligase n=1 Tax=Hyphopichia burtonii NRRL Y-1933 TaxID=984485 RepID=A0A1E4RPG4_9ASCO|nr:hypothetical protein HYPBUDRAFT_156174 [Hyphopichia burtonii NRRL Y-1933]ODV69164.1 hypothetical protein HYPBUDRAFT_156174 [Hyphopichia burtonii NRRL Y-1933]